MHEDGVIASVLVVAILIGAGAGYLIGMSLSGDEASIRTTSTSCIQTGISGSLFVRVISDNTNNPTRGANVTVTLLNYCNSKVSIPLGYTNDTGYTPSPTDWTGVLLVNVTSAGVDHVFLTETGGTVSLATISLPSGLTVVRPIVCYGPFPAAYGNTTTTTTRYVWDERARTGAATNEIAHDHHLSHTCTDRHR